MGKYNDKMEFVSLIDATGVAGIYPGHIALGVCIFGGEIIGADFTAEDTIGRESKIKNAFGLTAIDSLEDEVYSTASTEIKKPKELGFIKNIKMKNISTGEIVREFKTVVEMKDFLSISRGKAYDIIREKRNVDGFFYTTDAEEMYKDPIKKERKVRKYNLHHDNGERVLNVSVNQICDIVGITPTTAYKMIRENRKSRTGWYICEID